jgi:hypothetical protein
MAQWRDAEICVLKIRSISPYSALAWHATGHSYSFLLNMTKILLATLSKQLSFLNIPTIHTYLQSLYLVFQNGLAHKF